jgi:hypothetical protein
MRPLFGDQPSRPVMRNILAFGNPTRILLDKYLTLSILRLMAKKQRQPMTVAEAGRRGGKARAKKHTREQLSKWASLGGWKKGRPRKPKSPNTQKAR